MTLFGEGSKSVTSIHACPGLDRTLRISSVIALDFANKFGGGQEHVYGFLKEQVELSSQTITDDQVQRIMFSTSRPLHLTRLLVFLTRL